MKKSTRLNQRIKNLRSGRTFERTLSAAVIASAMMTGASLAQITYDTGGVVDITSPVNATNGIILSNDTEIRRDGVGDIITVPAGQDFDLRSGAVAGSGLLAGGGNLVKTTEGTVVLHNSNSFTGDVDILNGVLRIRGVNSLGNGADPAFVGILGELEVSLQDGSDFSRDVENFGIVSVSDNSTNPGDVEISGVITGPGLFIHEATGVTTLTNVDTLLNNVDVYTGTLQVAEDNLVAGNVWVGENGTFDTRGTLPGQNTVQAIDSLSGSGNVVIGGGTLITGLSDSIFSGNLLGVDGSTATGGTVIKDGDGIWEVTGNIDLAGINGIGTIAVTDGVLALDGNAFANVVVTNDIPNGEFGVLVGSGTVFGNVFNHSLVSPGSLLTRVGTLNVAGDYTQTATGNLGIALRSDSRRGFGYDHLSVDGVADLGGRLLVRTIDGYKPIVGNRYTIIEADGGVVGRFRRVRSSLDHTMLRLHPHYYNNHVVLRVEQIPFSSLQGLTHNQKQVAKALDHASARGEIQRVFDHLNYTDRSNVPGLIDLLSPESLTSIFTIGVATSQIQNVNIERRLDDVRAGSYGFSTNGLALSNNRGTINYDGAPIANTADGLTLAGWDGGTIVSKEVVAPVIEQSRWGFFATGTGEWADVENTGNSRGFSFRSAGFTLGADYRVSENLVVGVNAGYTNTSTKLPGDGSLDVDGGRGGVYATAFGGGAYVNAAVGGGYNSYRSRRETLGGKAHGDTDGGEFNALLGGGYDFQTGGLTVGPVGSFQYTYIGLNSFDETNSDAPQHFQSQHYESLRSLLGLKVAYAINAGSVVIKPEVRAQWKHEYLDSAASIDARFVGASKHYTVDGPDLGRDSLVLDAGASVEFNSSVSVFAYYTGELGRKNYDSHSVNGGFRVAF